MNLLSQTKITDSGGFLDPERIVRYFGLEKGDFVADFGAGHGYFTIPMARAVGGEGKVYAVDVQKSVLDVIRSKAKLEHLLNIELIWGNLEEPDGSHLKSDFIDFVVISNILFQADNKEAVIEEAYRILRSGGHMAIIEWDEASGRSAFGPPMHLRIPKNTAQSLAEKAGFQLDRQFEAGNHHYGLLFVKR
jgi:ubiquinone/menaquinone biosynthesis C-methylase UbiE